MTRQEHFEQWMRHNHPLVRLTYIEESDCYEGKAYLAYQAWKEAPLRRPCEKGQITEERLKELKTKDDPKTLVDRLNGWYSQTSEPYKVPKIQEEAAREIVRLRERLDLLLRTSQGVFDRIKDNASVPQNVVNALLHALKEKD